MSILFSNYEVLQTFSELSFEHSGNLIVVMKIVPFNKDFAKVAGWKFHSMTNTETAVTESWGLILNPKNHRLRKTSYIEDLADTVAGIVLAIRLKLHGQNKWVEEKSIKQSAASFCPAKF